MMRKHRWRLFARAAALAAVVAWFSAAAAGAQARSQDDDPAAGIDFKKVQAAQPALLQKQFAGLRRSEGGGDIYVIGVAGWSAQDVFISELDGAIASLAAVLPISGGRIVRLINNVRTLDTVPVASPDNFTAAVGAVGAAMDKQNDTLILFMTSHGTPGGIVLKLGPAFAELSPQRVAATLDENGIRNRIVIVSACYSGTYIKPLANEDTFVVTAADSSHPSFGCSARRRWTYFGDAFFSRSLRPGADFQSAFARAATMIRRWETAGNLPRSNPQAYFGAALAQKIDAVFKDAPAHPPVQAALPARQTRCAASAHRKRGASC